MKIFVISDIHTEFACETTKLPFNPFTDYDILRFGYPDEADVIVLAGDIGYHIDGMRWARRRFKNKEIVMVAGNHEFYENDISVVNKMRLAADYLNIHFLEKSSAVIDGVRFLGTTLWTDLRHYGNSEVNLAKSYLNDYRCINAAQWWQTPAMLKKIKILMEMEKISEHHENKLCPAITCLLFKESLEWLRNQLNDKYDGKTVVVTHHAPSLLSTSDSNMMKYSYASDLNEFILHHPEINLWLHGHIHQGVDYRIGATRIVSNPRGYPNGRKGLSKTFSETKIVEI